MCKSIENKIYYHLVYIARYFLDKSTVPNRQNFLSPYLYKIPLQLL